MFRLLQAKSGSQFSVSGRNLAIEIGRKLWPPTRKNRVFLWKDWSFCVLNGDKKPEGLLIVEWIPNRQVSQKIEFGAFGLALTGIEDSIIRLFSSPESITPLPWTFRVPAYGHFEVRRPNECHSETIKNEVQQDLF